MTFLDPYKRYALLLYATSKVAQHKKRQREKQGGESKAKLQAGLIN